MGKRGPKQTPTHLKILRGNPGHRPISNREPENRDGGADCPQEFEPDAQDEWGRMISHLKAMNLWSSEFRAGLIEYCEAFALKRQAMSMYRTTKQTPLIQTKQGNWIQHPLIGTINKQKQIMYRWLAEFGMTPASRCNVKVLGDKKPSIPTRVRA